MKLGISFLLLLSTLVQARPIQIHFEKGQRIEALIYLELFKKDYLIPEELITINRVHQCEGRAGRKELELCIKNNGDLMVISADKSFIRESLSVFRAP